MKISRKLSWGLIPLTLVVIAIVAFGTLMRPAQDSGLVAYAQEMKGLKQELIKANTDTAESLQRPAANREGSPSSANQQYFQERAYPAADIPADAYTQAYNQYQLMNQPGSTYGWKELGPLSTPDGSTWGPAAPSTISGRATAIAVDPSSCQAGVCGTIYLGTANGGIWKSTTGGKNWNPILDHQSTEAIGSLAVDPHNSNTIYAGTGEPNNAIDNNRGDGILKSTNGGRTWTSLGTDTFVNRAVSNVVVDPSNGNLYAISYFAGAGGSGTTYTVQAPNVPAAGFYRSTDGGQTWTLSNPTNPIGALGNLTGGTSLVQASNGTLYLAIFGQGIYTSSNGGQSWTALPNSHETAGNFDRVTLAVAPGNASDVYAAYSHTILGSGPMSFYASTDGGHTWTARPGTPDVCSDQCWYDMPIAVSPGNASEVYMGGMFNYDANTTDPMPADANTVIMKSTNAGTTWHDIGYSANGVNVHPDDHDIVATANGGLYTANDGGLFHSSNDGASWESLNNGIGSLQFTSVSVNSNGDVFGGTQDNGTWMMRNSSTNGIHILGGDGGMTAADPNNPNIVFDEYYGTQLQRFDASTGRQTWMAGWWCDYFCFGGGQFYQPVALGTKNPNGTSASNDVFSGSNRLWRSVTGGGTDGNHDGDATNDPTDTTDFVPLTPFVPNLSVIAVDPTNPNRVAFATSNGRIYFTTNALAPVTTVNLCHGATGGMQTLCSAAGVDPSWSGAKVCSQPWTNAYDTSSFCGYSSGVTWTRLDLSAASTKILPVRAVTGLTFAAGNLYVAFSGFDQNTVAGITAIPGHVWVTSSPSTTQGSTTWTNITANLPNMPVSSIVVNPKGHLFVGADYGVFTSKDGGSSWQREDYALANAPVYDLALSPDGSWLYAATHGRGIWKALAP